MANNALDITLQILRPGGNFFVKLFQGDLMDEFIQTVKGHFTEVKYVKPQASRAKSSEMYLLALGLKTKLEE